MACVRARPRLTGTEMVAISQLVVVVDVVVRACFSYIQGGTACVHTMPEFKRKYLLAPSYQQPVNTCIAYLCVPLLLNRAHAFRAYTTLGARTFFQQQQQQQ